MRSHHTGRPYRQRPPERASFTPCPDCDHGSVSYEGEPGDRWSATCPTCGGSGVLVPRG